MLMRMMTRIIASMFLLHHHLMTVIGDPQQDQEFGPYEDEFHYLLTKEPNADPEQAAAHLIQNPKYPILEDEDDQQVVQIDKEAGRIYRHDPPPLARPCQMDNNGDTLMDNDGECNAFFPFASELDWRVAHGW